MRNLIFTLVVLFSLTSYSQSNKRFKRIEIISPTNSYKVLAVAKTSKELYKKATILSLKYKMNTFFVRVVKSDTSCVIMVLRRKVPKKMNYNKNKGNFPILM